MPYEKVTCILLTVITTLMLCVSAAAYDEVLTILSELSDEELLVFLENSGVEIPAEYDLEEECIPFVRYVIGRLEVDGNAMFFFGYWFVEKFAAEIKAAVIRHYGNSYVAVYANSSSNILEDNVVVEEWNASHGNSNCYGYAIGYLGRIEPGKLARDQGYDPSSSNIMYADVEDMAAYVKKDLEFLGYADISVMNRKSAFYQVTEHQRLICMRMRTDTIGGFHFMVLEEDGCWYHKPGGSAPLKYLHTPSNDLGWVLEGYMEGVYSRDEDTVYASEIYYVSYRIFCENIQFVYLGNGKHVRACVDCGKTTGYESECVYANSQCRFCGSIEPNIQQSLPPVLQGE